MPEAPPLGDGFGHPPGTLPEPGRSDRFARIVIIPITLLFAVMVLVFYILFGATRVQGDSMVPALLPADLVLVTKSYGSPLRGDVVVVDLGTSAGEERIVKRIVARAGDTVEVKGDVAYVNGVEESGYDVVALPEPGGDSGPVTVPEGTVYVMGDNRPVSLDSRYLGPVPLEAVEGRVVAIFAPIGRLGGVPGGAALTASSAAD